MNTTSSCLCECLWSTDPWVSTECEYMKCYGDFSFFISIFSFLEQLVGRCGRWYIMALFRRKKTAERNTAMGSRVHDSEPIMYRLNILNSMFKNMNTVIIFWCDYHFPVLNEYTVLINNVSNFKFWRFLSMIEWISKIFQRLKHL